MSDRIYYSKEAEQYANTERLVLAVLVLITGLGIGTVLALLFAPQEGRETRKHIADGAEHILDNSRATGNKVVENVVDSVGKIRRTVEDRVGA
jgi:gas vesicle protein